MGVRVSAICLLTLTAMCVSAAAVMYIGYVCSSITYLWYIYEVRGRTKNISRRGELSGEP